MSSQVNSEALNQKPPRSLTKSFSFKSEIYLHYLSFTEMIGQLSQTILVKINARKQQKRKNKGK
jgi:hypothetical protein